MKKYFIPAILCILVCLAAVFFSYRTAHKNYYDLITMTGATPLAVSEKVPSHFELTVDGMVKKTYHFSASALNGFAHTRIRTREFSPDGTFLGAYMYLGIPVFNILEGVAPQKPVGVIFDQPLDILVEFTSASGVKRGFSFNELLMTDDKYPVTLAYKRAQIVPTNENLKDTYQKNRYTTTLTSFRLICPKEPDNGRYLDDVTTITYTTIASTPDELLPRRQKGRPCKSTTIYCIADTAKYRAQLEQVAPMSINNWVRIGHGHGFNDIANISGFSLRSFLSNNFTINNIDQTFFLFAACDGYRALFSGREIFATFDGNKMVIVEKINGQPHNNGYMLAPAADFFNDRAIWGLQYVVQLAYP